MIVYHGSTHRFKKLRIGKSLVECRSTVDNEGYGIYFSTDRTVAESYGPYIYVLEINDECLEDFREKEVCRRYLNDLCDYVFEKTGILLNEYVNLSHTLDRMRLGGLAISGVGREIYLLLDSEELFYRQVCETKREKLYRLLRNYDRKHLDAYMFEYHIKNIGVIKNVSTDVVKIIRREDRC